MQYSIEYGNIDAHHGIYSRPVYYVEVRNNVLGLSLASGDASACELMYWRPFSNLLDDHFHGTSLP